MDPHAGRPENHSYIATDLNICLVTFSTLIVIARLYSRLGYIKSFGLDDAIALLAWAVICSESALEFVEAKRGTGQHIWDIPPVTLASFFSLVPTMELLYILGTGLVRFSIVTFLPRLNRSLNKRFNRVIYSLGAAIIVVTVVFFVFYITSCRPLRDLWNQKPTSKCLSHPEQTIFFCVHQALGSVFDLCLLSVPIWLVYSHMIFNARTAKVMLGFSVGLFVFAVGIVRFVVTYRVNETIDTTWYLLQISIWSGLEMHVGLWVACFPALVPLFRLASEKLDPKSRSYSSFSAFDTPNIKAHKHARSASGTGDGTASEDGMVRAGHIEELTDVGTWGSSKANLRSEG